MSSPGRLFAPVSVALVLPNGGQTATGHSFSIEGSFPTRLGVVPLPLARPFLAAVLAALAPPTLTEVDFPCGATAGGGSQCAVSARSSTLASNRPPKPLNRVLVTVE